MVATYPGDATSRLTGGSHVDNERRLLPQPEEGRRREMGHDRARPAGEYGCEHPCVVAVAWMTNAEDATEDRVKVAAGDAVRDGSVS